MAPALFLTLVLAQSAPAEGADPAQIEALLPSGRQHLASDRPQRSLQEFQSLVADAQEQQRFHQPHQGIPHRRDKTLGNPHLGSDRPEVKEHKIVPMLAVDIAGHTDKSGGSTRNAQLAKDRAKAVRAALIAQGARPEQTNLKMPAAITGGPGNVEARRVDVVPTRVAQAGKKALSGPAAAAPR